MCLHTNARKPGCFAPGRVNGTATPTQPSAWLSIDPRSPRLAAALQSLAGATVYIRHRRFCGTAELLRACGNELLIHPHGRSTSPVAILSTELFHLHVYS